MIDIPTLSLAMGLASLAFAALATTYAWSASAANQPLSIWRWSRLISGVAFLLIWLRPVIPLWLSLTVSHLLLIIAWALEYGAYARLLDRRNWHQVLILLTGMAVIAQLVLHGAGVPRRVDLIFFSAVNGVFFSAMAVLLFTNHQHGLLVRLMGVTNGVAGCLFFGRVVSLLWLDNLTHPTYLAFHISLFVVGYVIIIINGYGFLLLAKQNDDHALRAALADVAQAEAEQRQLLSLASHEFRTPAAMIRTSLDSLRFLADRIPDEVALRLENIRQATERLIHLTNALITQDRLRELRFGLVRQEVDASALVRQVVGRYAEPIHCEIEVAEWRMRIDPELLAIALHNLLDNALRHCTADQPLAVRLRVVEGSVEIAVADHGPGVPDAEKALVFERFYRRDAGPGSGLGLSIVRTIARLHGGDATVHDQAPHGAVFVIRLPLTPSPNSTTPTGHFSAPASASAPGPDHPAAASPSLSRPSAPAEPRCGYGYTP